MTDYHTVYKGLPTDTTQWEDIHRRLGNFAPKAPVWKPEKYTPEQEQEHDQGWLDTRDEQELSDLEDELTDDRILEQYRQRRLHELRHAVSRPRFGTVEEIRSSEFVQQVTEASKGVQQPAQQAAATQEGGASGTAAAQPSSKPQTGGDAAGTSYQGEDEGEEADKGLWVVVQLYKDGHGGSALMSKCLTELAEQYPSTKFVRIVSTDCIPKYPDANLPTLLVYHKGQCVKHLVGLSQFGGQRATPEQVALVLNGLGPVCSNAEDDEDQAKDELQLVRKMVDRMMVQREEGDESSDFDD